MRSDDATTRERCESCRKKRREINRLRRELDAYRALGQRAIAYKTVPYSGEKSAQIVSAIAGLAQGGQ